MNFGSQSEGPMFQSFLYRSGEVLLWRGPQPAWLEVEYSLSTAAITFPL